MPIKEAVAPTAISLEEFAKLRQRWREVLANVPPIVDRLRGLASDLETKFAALGPAKPKPRTPPSSACPKWDAYIDDQRARVNLIEAYEQQAYLSLRAATLHGSLSDVYESLGAVWNTVRTAARPGQYVPCFPRLALAMCRELPGGAAKSLRVTLSASSPDTIGLAVAESIRFFARMAEAEVVQFADDAPALSTAPKLPERNGEPSQPGSDAKSTKPRFSKASGVLRIGDRDVLVVKADSQLARVLQSFEEQGWQTVVDDPLPKPRRRRCSQVADRLNRGQKPRLIRFSSQRDGKAFSWRFQEAD